MGFLSKFLKLNGTVFVGGVSFTAYSYPELRSNPKQLMHALIRGGRLGLTGALMASDYLIAMQRDGVNAQTHARASNRMYQCFVTNGGPYIKFGQMMGQLDQLIPLQYITAFEPMLMQAPRTCYADVKSIVEEDLGAPIDTLFSEFAESPIASASLGQVHKATLRATGEEVAVKVQHKWIMEQVPGDLRLVNFVSDVAMAIFPDYKYGWLPEEFRTRLPDEINFKKEADNCERCAEIFRGNPNVAVPSVYRDYTTQRVLTMTFEKGISVSRVKDMHEQGIDLKRLARVISETFNHMIYKVGFVHSDPHPGNLFVRPKVNKDGSKDLEIVLLDHGIYTDLKDDVRLSYTKLWRGLLTQDEKKIRDASKELGADFYELFSSMIVGRKYEDIMDPEQAYKTKSRLGEKQDKESHDAIQQYAVYYHKDIVEILDQIKRELLLLLKTNNYLRAIDKRLGNPNNTYNIINNVTWKVYCQEIAKLSTWDYYRELGHYFVLKMYFAFYIMKIKIQSLFGIKASPEELQDFDLDYNQ